MLSGMIMMNNAILGGLVTFVSMLLWFSLHQSCTVTFKDYQGAYHQMTGKADD
jgi:hypothetical protein